MERQDIPCWPVGVSEMCERIRTFDWAATSMGPLYSWPQKLKAATEILLGLSVPGMLLWGTEGVVIYNDAYSSVAGRLHPHLLGRPVTQGWPEQGDFHAHVLDMVLKGGSLAYRDRPLSLIRDGQWEAAWFNLDYSPVLDEQGCPAGVFSIATETTGRVQTERALRSSEARLSAIFARAKVGLSEISLEGRFLRVNDELCSMLGRPHSTLLQLGVRDVTHPEDLPNSLKAFAHLIETGLPTSVDKRYIRADGGIVWASSSLSRLDGEGGHAPTVLAVTVDMTARKHAEQALAANEARFRALAEASPALIWHLGPDGSAIYINPRTLELLGKREDELLGTKWVAVLHPDDAAVYLAGLAQAQQERIPLHQRMRVVTARGDWHWLESHASPWFTPDDGYAGHIGISLDITDAVRVQEELMISNERLKLAIEGSGDGIWDWNVQSGDMLVSPRLEEILGLSGRDSVRDYAAWERRVHPDDLPHVLGSLRSCLGGESDAFKHEYRIKYGDDDWKWVLARAIVVARDARGKPLRMTGTMTDISEKRRSEEAVWRHANFDALTGLPNRRLFRDRLDHDVRKARRTGLPAALLFIDLDHFKEANDLLGHDVGDQLLVEAARRISRCVRSSDTVARLGGDEFTAILSELDDLRRVEMIAQNMIDALAAPFRLGNEVVYLSASIGITLYPDDGEQPEDLVRNADQAMYAAKNGGRNQFNYFTRSMQQQAHARLRLIADLRKALSGRQLEVFYQPVVDLSSGAVAKAEALLRWQHPKLGMIEPQRFIPYAEESGLIKDIGEWVFMQAVERSARWSMRRGAPFQISVNKSPVQFLSRSEGVNWVDHLRESGLPGNSISVEITEGMLLNASSTVTNRLLQYRDAGIQVAIDDFGTGYSSMAYLRKFDIDYLKIDQSFVREVASNSGDRAIVRSIIAMAHELGLQVIAEGIETTEQKQTLVDAGCDFGQGFLFSHPLPADEFERVLHI